MTNLYIAFHRFVIGLTKSNRYLFAERGNSEELLLRFNMPTDTAVERKGKKRVIIRTIGSESVAL
jgi:hypothetical protein